MREVNMKKSFITEIIEADDGTGDGILQFPDEMLQDEDWREGDVLKLLNENNTIVITNVTKKERDEGLPQQLSLPLD
jgi:hypothetical protein